MKFMWCLCLVVIRKTFNDINKVDNFKFQIGNKKEKPRLLYQGFYNSSEYTWTVLDERRRI